MSFSCIFLYFFEGYENTIFKQTVGWLMKVYGQEVQTIQNCVRKTVKRMLMLRLMKWSLGK